jgi:hypothetical protein
MPLSADDFVGFNPSHASAALRLFNNKARRAGQEYYQEGRVRRLDCIEPGVSYRARVQGGGSYEVSLNFDGKAKQWLSLCTCSIGFHCKHAYAALQQLLVEHSQASVDAYSSSAIKRSPQAPQAAPSRPLQFEDQVVQKLGRPLKPDEQRYLGAVHGLYRAACANRAVFVRDLTPFGIPLDAGWWDKVELWTHFPETEAEFWNCLALYFEQHGVEVPGFLRPVTNVEKIRAGMRNHLRGREISRWAQQLAHVAPPVEVVESHALPAELRLCFHDDMAQFEWRVPGGDWAALKSRKYREFEARHGAGLSHEAALLWQPVEGNPQSQFSDGLRYLDPWALSLLNRWLRLPMLRPLLVTSTGEPLVFHAEPLRWSVSEPADEDGDYTLRLVRADGAPAPATVTVFDGRPYLYFTKEGVFAGPMPERNLLGLSGPNLIPAKAFESAGGLRLIENLQAELPPRLAARIRILALQPLVVAELKQPWAGSETEYCHLHILGASADRRHLERWDGRGWHRAHDLVPHGAMRDNALERVDRAALAGLPAPVLGSGFKWDYSFSVWTARLTKKFPEMFVPFLQSLPPGTNIELRGELAAFRNAEVAGRIRLEATEAGQDWFDLRVLVDVNDATLTEEEIKLLLDAKGKWVRLGNKGWKKLEFKLSEEEDRELARLGLTPHELTSEPQRMHALQLADQAARKFLPEETCARIERRAAELQARVTPDVPAGIQAEMRPYQRDGFHFLAYLSTNRFGGILADDMGLGKTLQTLAWIEWLRSGGAIGVAPANAPAPHEKSGRNGGPATSLVVCPKSVADNWHAEAGRFLPGLRVKAWSAGDLQDLPGSLDSADLHVINYNQLRAVGDELTRARFLAVILDEGQYIKNPTSLTGQIARKLRAEHRLILSGTPIENRLLDLWSLMSFAMPGALGSRAEFGRLYDAKGDPFARQRLSARVRPFLIRRTKAQVARDLPDRIEEDLFCELEGEQKTLYRAELKRAQAMLLGIKTAAALNKERFNFLTSLLRLRQICCHPKLAKPDSKAASAKMEALLETLEPLMEEGQKVLIFSQFVEMLNLIRGELKERGWKHWYLAGDTENRGDLVRDFQGADGGGVFLISLKAGGFGLNLTASSYVILFDPWWNPAVENQAIDRTHRIGQTQKVIAYRLLIKNSIEEKIRALQRQKKGLAEDVLGEEKFAQSLSLDDLRYLLAE